MLGDDDGLMPGYVARDPRARRALRGARRHLPERLAVLLSRRPAVRARGLPAALRLLDVPARRPRAVRPRSGDRAQVGGKAMRFRVRHGFNMQFSTVSRRLVDELAPQGPFFQSAFPGLLRDERPLPHGAQDRRRAAAARRRSASRRSPTASFISTPRRAPARRSSARTTSGPATASPTCRARTSTPGWLSAVEAIAAALPGARADRAGAPALSPPASGPRLLERPRRDGAGGPARGARAPPAAVGAGARARRRRGVAAHPAPRLAAPANTSSTARSTGWRCASSSTGTRRRSAAAT